jgi:Ni,Fe-hydrogenase III large subunit
METALQVVATVRERIAAGARFAWLFGDEHAGSPVLHFVVEAERRLEHYFGLVEGTVPSLADVAAGARWHEREAGERFGITFSQVDASAPSIVPRAPEDVRTMDAPEVSTIVYGPIRSGIVEAASWIVETAGEDFLRVTPSMFYKRRDIEKAFEGARIEHAPLLAEHASGATALSHASAFCKTAESALRMEISPGASAVRVALVELERIHQHLDALAKLADDASLSVGTMQTYAVKERVHRLLADATGSRFGRGTICVGGLRFDASASLLAVCARDLDVVERETEAVLRLFFTSQSLLDRLIGAGRISQKAAIAYGAVGPLARGSGLPSDARVADTTFPLREDEAAIETGGDALARALVRRAEISQSFSLVRRALEAASGHAFYRPPLVQNGAAVGRIESPQGELVYYVRFDDGLQRVAIRSASYQNWPLFVPSLPGNIFTDFSFIEHSLGLLQAETDR